MGAPLATNPPVFFSACFFSVNNGQTVQRRISAADEKGPAGTPMPGGGVAQGPLPNGVTNVYRFDESGVNNAGLLAQWSANSAQFTMAGNQVLVNAQPAQFDPPSLVFLAMQNAAAAWAKAQTLDAFSQQEVAQHTALLFQLARNAGLL